MCISSKVYVCVLPICSVIFRFGTFIIYFSSLLLNSNSAGHPGTTRKGGSSADSFSLLAQPGQEVVPTNLPSFSSVETVVDDSGRT